ncbi:MAG TPA: hypothetical protein VM165_10835 [Planctomycetaceae bacterium]|nr:hypothetical protein [Planctomycetaceae bacterium]
MSDVKHLTTAELEAGLDVIRQSPSETGTLDLIVRRPATDLREMLERGELDLARGLIGDIWNAQPNPNLDSQINIMNARVVALISPDPDRRPLAGDQLYLDFDLSVRNLPAGTRLAIGDAVVEVTPEPHTGCVKFTQRFGLDAMRFVNSPVGKELRLRGLNAKVVQPGTIQAGDVVRKLPPSA